ncbi:hypothetical protein VTO42DRAFT_7767 [Malbranchea cinnamomea]
MIEQVDSNLQGPSSHSTMEDRPSILAVKQGAIVPATPASVHEAYEAAVSDQSETEEFPRSSPTAPLTEDELKYLFSGAPHFVLERGARGHWYPHALFPWDDCNFIQNLRDRRPLSHPMCALSTLHAHLPPVVKRSGILPYQSEYSASLKSKRPMFDIGVYEVPNMLSFTAKESGCVGFRYFLELPISHTLRDGQFAAHRPSFGNYPAGTVGPSSSNEPYADCRPGVVLDRLSVITEGPSAWRRLGIRDCSIKSIALRIQLLCELRDRLIDQKAPLSLLDIESIPVLYDQLFTMFLYPPQQNRADQDTETLSLRSQIDVLVRVLSVKGAWIDFSLVEWRLRFGQVLWETTPHQDGDCIDHPVRESQPGADAERKWLLLQILLATELLLRVDAAVKVGIVGSALGHLDITPHDVYYMNCLRTDKLDWDLICCRWALDNVIFQYQPVQDELSTLEESQRSMHQKIRSKFSVPKRRRKGATESAWDCVVLPRYPWQQFHGLLFFARTLQWPGLDSLKAKLDSNFMLPSTHVNSMFASPVSPTPLPDQHQRLGRGDMYRKSGSARLVQLHMPPSSDLSQENGPPFTGGWLSRTFLSGWILPGEGLNGLLMSTILENDPPAMKALGPVANLYGGFVYEGRSWWSAATIVSRILSCLHGSVVCRGWVFSPVVPQDTTGFPLSAGWFEIEVQDDARAFHIPQIYQGAKVFLDSSPLGIEGEMTPGSFILPVDDPNVGYLEQTKVTFRKITLIGTVRRFDPSTALFPRKASATATFIVDEPDLHSTQATFPLMYNVQFISSFTCLPPIGRTRHLFSVTKPGKSRQYYHSFHENKFRGQLSQTELLALRKTQYRRPRLPGHPLHTSSYPYSYIPLPSLPTMASLPPSPGTDFREQPFPHRRSHRPKHTFILDARGSKDKECFARAWCAAVGTSAVVSRTGRTCLACSIREARAADVSVVIRVGSLGM